MKGCATAWEALGCPPSCCLSCHQDEACGYELPVTVLPDGTEATVSCAVLAAQDHE